MSAYTRLKRARYERKRHVRRRHKNYAAGFAFMLRNWQGPDPYTQGRFFWMNCRAIWRPGKFMAPEKRTSIAQERAWQRASAPVVPF